MMQSVFSFEEEKERIKERLPSRGGVFCVDVLQSGTLMIDFEEGDIFCHGQSSK